MSAARPGTRRRDVWPYVLVMALGCFAYAGSADVYFLKDDLALSRITDAEGRPDAGALVHNFLWPAPLTYPQVYRPVPILFGWFDFVVFGADPRGFRICNIGFHGLNAALLAILFNQLTGFRRPAAGLFAGALFALHPVHGEAVLWITQRMVVLCATFSLLSLIGLEAFLRTGRRGALIAWLGAAALAALSKEVTLLLPGVMLILAWLHPAARRARVRRTLQVAAAGAGIALLVIVPRMVFFGDWVGKYTHLTPAEYAAEFRVYERLPRSLLDGLWAVNPAEVPPGARLALGIAWLAFLVLAVVLLAPALADRGRRRAAIAFAAFAILSFLPTLPVFFIEPTLTNGRFLYQPLVGAIGLLLLGFAGPGGHRPLLRFSAPAALLVLFALALQFNLRAFHGADAQIAAVRGGIMREVRRVAGDPIVVLYGTPTGHHGVVTLDTSLALAMKPPFVAPPGLDVVPLVGGLERSWPDRIADVRAHLEQSRDERRPLLHLVARAGPDRVSPLLGALAPPSGPSPPMVLAPSDGALVLHPDEEPAFVLEPVPGAAIYRLRFEFEPAAELDDIVLDLDPARHLARSGTRLVYRFSQGHAGDMPLAWNAHTFENPLPLGWSIEALDAQGRSLGRSGQRALVLLTRQVPRG